MIVCFINSEKGKAKVRKFIIDELQISAQRMGQKMEINNF